LEGKESLSPVLSELSRKIINLTKEQLDVLDSLNDNPRLLVLGCAGSGKTLLALHKAKCLASEGKKVLLLCYNRALGSYLMRECREFPNIIVGPSYKLPQAKSPSE
jgi:superfamily I DNA and RNA helicase